MSNCDGLARVSAEGDLQPLGGGNCTHVAWTGVAILAACAGAIQRFEGDELVASGSPIHGAVKALVGLDGGAIILGTRADDAGDPVLWAQPLDARGRAAAEPHELARSPFVEDAAALGLGDRLLVAWPGLDHSRKVTYLAVLDGNAQEIAPPYAPFAAPPGVLASDGATGLLGWTGPDGVVRAARIDRDGTIVPDIASSGGIALGSFGLESAIGVAAGPTLLFGQMEWRLLRFVPDAL